MDSRARDVVVPVVLATNSDALDAPADVGGPHCSIRAAANAIPDWAAFTIVDHSANASTAASADNTSASKRNAAAHTTARTSCKRRPDTRQPRTSRLSKGARLRALTCERDS